MIDASHARPTTERDRRGRRPTRVSALGGSFNQSMQQPFDIARSVFRRRGACVHVPGSAVSRGRTPLPMERDMTMV